MKKQRHQTTLTIAKCWIEIDLHECDHLVVLFERRRQNKTQKKNEIVSISICRRDFIVWSSCIAKATAHYRSLLPLHLSAFLRLIEHLHEVMDPSFARMYDSSFEENKEFTRIRTISACDICWSFMFDVRMHPPAPAPYENSHSNTNEDD